MTNIQWFLFVIAPLTTAAIAVIVGESFRARHAAALSREANASTLVEETKRPTTSASPSAPQNAKVIERPIPEKLGWQWAAGEFGAIAAVLVVALVTWLLVARGVL
jgi:hypothetical protein